MPRCISKWMDLFSNPLFKKSLFDFNSKMQMEGIEAAKKFWNMNPAKDSFPFGAEMFEKLADLYIILGFVPHYKYDEAVNEKEGLKKENEFLRETSSSFRLTCSARRGRRRRSLGVHHLKAVRDEQGLIAKYPRAI